MARVRQLMYPIVTICGSMRNYPKMLLDASHYTTKGYIVLMPFVVAEENTVAKKALDDMHRAKILMASRVVVSGAYFGDSTKGEIQFAHDHGIPVFHRVNDTESLIIPGL